jgi:hypothetical protein
MQSPDVLLQTSSPSENALYSPITSFRDDDAQSQADFSFLITEALWHDILACATTGQIPRIPYRQWLDGSDLAMEDLMGCYNWVMIAIGDLTHLQAWKKDMKQKGALSMPELVRRGQRIERRLQDGIKKLKETKEVSPNSSRSLHYHIADNSIVSRQEAVPEAIFHQLHTSRIFLLLHPWSCRAQ